MEIVMAILVILAVFISLKIVGVIEAHETAHPECHNSKEQNEAIRISSWNNEISERRRELNKLEVNLERAKNDGEHQDTREEVNELIASIVYQKRIIADYENRLDKITNV